jgi:2-keto-3-deoxy-L-fuconate dehydrogenase
MNDRLKGKCCVVTAAGQGIGRAIAQAFAQEGATRVVAVDIRPDGLGQLTGVERIVADATDPKATATLAARFADTSVLVNCVGYVANGTILDTTVEMLQQSFTLNVLPMHNYISAFLPAMLGRSDGAIINIASVVSSVMGAPNRYAYGTTKAAVLGLTKSVARDYVTQGIRCNAISPGTIETPSLHDRMAAQGDREEARRAFIARQPMGRLGSAQEIAAIAVMLASDEARFMTGANLIIDGGMSL